MKHTRKDYLDGKCSHREYYAQFVTDYVKRAVIRAIGTDAILASKDESLNDIPLHKWDAIIGWSDFGRSPISSDLGIGQMLKDAGDFVTASGLVCAMKEAAKQIREQAKQN